MELGLGNIFLAIGAGLASVASPCVLPVVPIVITGTNKDDKLRPLLIVLGLTITFIIMGIISSAFGSLIMGKMQYAEKIVGIVIASFGVLLILDINIFKRLHWLQNIQVKSNSRWSGFFLGLALGIIWIPCIGPFLSSILAIVAKEGQLMTGIIFLSFYSLGFAIPMLSVGYLSQFTRSKMKVFQKNEKIVRYVSGFVLIFFGLYLFWFGALIRF